MKLNRTNVRLLFITATIVGFLINAMEGNNSSQTKEVTQINPMRASVIN